MNVNSAGKSPRIRPLRRPQTGDLVHLTATASVQFGGDRTTWFRIIGVDPRPTYPGWIWLVGYALDDQGTAVLRREVFVQTAGLIFGTPGKPQRRG